MTWTVRTALHLGTPLNINITLSPVINHGSPDVSTMGHEF
jgi:hypothetical protein